MKEANYDLVIPAAHRRTEQLVSRLKHFMHIEAVSGLFLLFAAVVAMVWANTHIGPSYADFWHTPLTLGIGSWVVSQSLHFWINEALMSIFFLVVGMEIKREIHNGALSTLRSAALPVAGAIGGVVVPAAIYLFFNRTELTSAGWAIPAATDIAFAVGVLALLGKSIPSTVRVLLLTLAIIDDVLAVLIIAIFYSGGLTLSGIFVAFIGIALVLVMQRLGIRNAYLYIVPGVILWTGLLITGAHPALAGVVLGLMTPIVKTYREHMAYQNLSLAVDRINTIERSINHNYEGIALTAKTLKQSSRDLLPPALRLQQQLHPWVAFCIMPLFALANAGIYLGGISLGYPGAVDVILGVTFALVIGKPLGIVLFSWLFVKLGLTSLPDAMSWKWLWLIGFMAGIGFTMSIFIGNLAFLDPTLLESAKIGVIMASALAAAAGISLGFLLKKDHKP